MRSFAIFFAATLAIVYAAEEGPQFRAFSYQIGEKPQATFQAQPIAFQFQSDEPQFRAFSYQIGEQATPVVLVPQTFNQVKYIPIIAASHVAQENGAFQLKYQSADGQSVSEQGSLKRNLENTGDVLVKSGEYSYTAPDGTPVVLSYVADEQGFRASGSHIPKAPKDF